jgi:SAM-dependent methyltransferase
MNDFYDPDFYELRIGPGSRVGPLYLREACEFGGEVLELGCGTGDVLLPIARAGLRVTGVDSSRPMIERFRERLQAEPEAVRARVTLIEGGMETTRVQDAVDQVFIPNDGIAHLLTQEALRATLSACFEQLVPGGRLVLDISPFDIVHLARCSGSAREVLRFRGKYPARNGRQIQVWERTSYDRPTGILHADFRYEFLDPRGQVEQIQHRSLALYPRRPDEALLALEVCGFRPVVAEPVTPEERMCAMLIRAERPRG